MCVRGHFVLVEYDKDIFRIKDEQCRTDLSLSSTTPSIHHFPENKYHHVKRRPVFEWVK